MKNSEYALGHLQKTSLPECENEKYMETISKEKLAWLAGIIDGEGSILVNYNNVRHSMRLQIGNSSPLMIERISEIYVALGIRFFYQLVKLPSGKYFMRIEAFGTRGVAKICKAIKEYSVAKRAQIDSMIEFADWRKTISQKKYPSGYKNEEIIAKYVLLKEKLSLLNKADFNLQRLPRKASEVLNVSKLQEIEAMV